VKEESTVAQEKGGHWALIRGVRTLRVWAACWDFFALRKDAERQPILVPDKSCSSEEILYVQLAR
jgi:hypothetical protein